MKTYEYDVREFKGISKDLLNCLGEDGWQVVGMEKTNEGSYGTYTVFLMRELEPDEVANPYKQSVDMIGNLLGKLDFSKGFSLPDSDEPETVTKPRSSAAESLRHLLDLEAKK